HQAGVVDITWLSNQAVASADDTNMLWLWNSPTGQVVRSHTVKRPYRWSAGKTLVYRRGDKEFTFWDPNGGSTRSLTLKDHPGAVGGWDLSPDSKLLAVGGADAVSCWDAASGKLLGRSSGFWGGPGLDITAALDFSPDGTMLIARWR